MLLAENKGFEPSHQFYPAYSLSRGASLATWVILHLWRRDRDSNPGYAHTHAGFQDRCLKPTRPSLQDNINYINHYKLCQYIFVNFFIFYLSLITTSKFPVSGSIINPCTFIFFGTNGCFFINSTLSFIESSTESNPCNHFLIFIPELLNVSIVSSEIPLLIILYIPQLIKIILYFYLTIILNIYTKKASSIC